MKAIFLMKFISFIALLFIVNTIVLADSSIRTVSHFGGFYENSNSCESYGVDALINTDSYGVVAYLGVSLNNIKTDKVIDGDNQTDVNTAFFFGGVKATLPISPYLELGKDLGESFINDVISADLENTDYYLSLGLTTSQKYNLGASIYYKLYSFGYFDGADERQRMSVNLPGLRIFFRFR